MFQLINIIVPTLKLAKVRLTIITIYTDRIFCLDIELVIIKSIGLQRLKAFHIITTIMQSLNSIFFPISDTSELPKFANSLDYGIICPN